MSLFDELKRRNVLRVAIAYLAAAWFLIEVADTILPRLGLGDAAVTNIIIVLAIGFMPVLVLSWIFEWTPAGVKRDAGSSSPTALAPRTGRKFDAAIIVVLLFAIGFFAFDKFVLDPTRDSLEIEAATEQARTDAVLGSYGDKSIAVLAFRDMSPAHDQEYFSDGIAEELLNVLARIRQLRVISRSSAFSFKGSGATVPEIAKKLNVSYVLEGSVRKAGNKIRITAQLIDARTDTHIWSETYDRELDDIFLIQDEISANIVEQLKIRLFGALPSARPIDSAAYELYLRARFIIQTEKADSYRAAQKFLNEVLTIEPNYIPALNQLARVYYRVPKSEGMSREQNTQEIHKLADRIIALEPDGSDALIWQGWFAYLDGRNQDAAHFYEKALQVNPNQDALLRVLVPFLGSIGRNAESIAVGKHLAIRDPACVVCAGNLARTYKRVGKYEEAALVLESAMTWSTQTDWLYSGIGDNWVLAGYPQKALASYQKIPIENEQSAGMIMALHDVGRMEEFESRFARLRSDAAKPEGVARIYAWIGNSHQAFEWLDKAIELQGPELLRRLDSAAYQKITSDPRWRELQDQHGYSNDPVQDIEFDFVLPPGASLEAA